MLHLIYNSFHLGSSPLARGTPPPIARPPVPVPGSSPLARGTLGRLWPAGCWAGLIPARAGNTISSSVMFIIIGAHPRSRGEHLKYLQLCYSVAGSSPLARGTRRLQSMRDGGSGLIPARAGNTRFPMRRCRFRRAHPRSRGEHVARLFFRLRLMGSSPLARGTLVTYLSDFRFMGLIPARAGNTTHPCSRYPIRRAHPRSRGEHAAHCVVESFA